MKIAIYDDLGVGQNGMIHLFNYLPLHFDAKIEFISAKKIIKKGINADLLIIGGGADRPYCQKLNGLGNAKIKEFIENGGFYLGICAGAYYGCEFVDFMGEHEIIFGKRELALFAGTGKGSLADLTQNHYYSNDEKSSTFLKLNEWENELFYYHGGCAFINGTPENIIAHYENGLPAIISGKYGKGTYLLSGVHFENNRHSVIWDVLKALLISGQFEQK